MHHHPANFFSLSFETFDFNITLSFKIFLVILRMRYSTLISQRNHFYIQGMPNATIGNACALSYCKVIINCTDNLNFAITYLHRILIVFHKTVYPHILSFNINMLYIFLFNISYFCL